VSSERDGSDYGGDVAGHGPKIRSAGSVKTRQQHIAQIVQKYADSPLTTLAHHLDMLWMHTAFARVRKDSAPGVDGMMAEEYALNLEANLADLLERAKSGRYKAPPVKRKWIPKNENEFRAIGIPTLEDKILQRAIAMLLEPMYEQIFLDCSYGFRPRRSAHQALDAVRDAIREVNGGWVLDVDIKAFFDTIPHKILREILRKRINDSVVLRLLGKWLKAGVMDDGVFHRSTAEGTPQGGVISPLISNVYLHEVLDEWFAKIVKPCLKGKAKLVRFADDFVIVFERLDDAGRVMNVLPKRFEKYGLQLHPEKTRLVDFCHPWESHRKPGTFVFLGFTFYWGKTKNNGYAVKKKTAAKKFRRSLKQVHTWCKKNRHKPIAWLCRKLSEKLNGHYAYYGVTGNYKSIVEFRYRAERILRYWLNRRSRKGDGMSWHRFGKLMRDHFTLPKARIVHPAKTEHQLVWNI
jgi:RNA-directed DNA polymerase